METTDPPVRLRSLPAFVRFWWCRLIGTGAQQMLMVALGWQMYELTGSAWDLGLVGLYQFVPALALALVAGHVADRYDRRRVLAACFALQAAAALLLTVASASGGMSRAVILGVSLLFGVARAFQMPSQQSLVPQLVPASVLPRALASSSVALQCAVIGGPALGGFVYAAGASVVYGLCAALFAGATLLALAIRYQHVAPGREPTSLATLFAGVTFIWKHPAVLGAISLDLFAVLLGGATALLPIFAKDILHVGPLGLGLLRGAPAAGALLMSVWLARRPIERRVGARLFTAVAIFGGATVVFGLSTSFWLSLAALFITGGADVVSVVVRQAMVQLDTPDAMRGRVSAVNSIFIGASNQLGEFESGAMAAWLGPVGSVVLGGVGTLLVVVLWMRLFPELAKRQTLRQAVD